MIEFIRNAIRDSGLTLVELSEGSGVTPGQLSRFLRGERTITLPAAERLCGVLGLELRRVRKRSERKRKG